MKALVVAGGNVPVKSLLKDIASKCDIIIGADRGVQYILSSDILPNYMVGDFDSLDTEIINDVRLTSVEKIEYSSEKDYTDSKIAFDLAIEKGASKIYLVSVTGTRLDHSLSNLGLLKEAAKRKVEACIIDNNNYIYMVDKELTIKRKDGYKYISFLAYEGVVENLSILDAKYELKNYDLAVGDGRTVSNEFINDEINITFNKGKLLVIYSID